MGGAGSYTAIWGDVISLVRLCSKAYNLTLHLTHVLKLVTQAQPLLAPHDAAHTSNAHC